MDQVCGVRLCRQPPHYGQGLIEAKAEKGDKPEQDPTHSPEYPAEPVAPHMRSYPLRKARHIAADAPVPPKGTRPGPPVAWPEGTDQIIGRRNEHHGGNDPRDTQPASHTQGFAHGKPEKGIRQRIEKQVFHEPEVPDLHMPGSRRAQNRKNDQGKSQMKQLDGHETPKSVAVAAGRDEVARNKEVKPHEKRSVYRKEVPQPHGTFGQ